MQPGLCRHTPGHSLGKNIKLHEMKNENNYMGFLIHNTPLGTCAEGVQF